MRFDEFWTSREQRDELAVLVKSAAAQGEVIEVGTWQGLSAIPLANAINPAVLHVVDHWEGDGPDPSPAGIKAEAAARDNYGIFLDNIKEGTEGNIKVWKMGWREFAAQWADPIRFLYLDAAHSTREVSDNIAALRPFATAGTIFAGDDWYLPEVAAGVREHFPEREISVKFGKLWWVTL